MDNSRLSSRPTLVRRVSDLFKESHRSGPQLFRKSSMEKLRHCCQNLNLFPYLLYSLGDPKASSQKLTINQLISKFTDLLFGLYLHIRLGVRRRLHLDSIHSAKSAKPYERALKFKVVKPSSHKPKETSLLLTFAVYLAPLVLGCQLIAILTLIVLGKYTPGFVFLISALLFLGYIFLEVLGHDPESHEYKKREKRKAD